jgi:transcriptional regulator with XRE-family HTH domain
MDSQELFGSRIRSIREGLDLSREAVSEKAQINSNYLGEIERGEKWPSIDVIQRLASALDVRPSRFFEYEAEEVDLDRLLSQLHRLLSSRKTEELQQATRLLNALFRL